MVGESSGWHSDSATLGGNTVAAQRRILTVFPIYFLRLPAASGGFFRMLYRYMRYLCFIESQVPRP